MSKIYFQEETERYLFQCPGCVCLHFFDKSWSFNGDFEKPTVSPSIRVGEYEGDIVKSICHFFLRAGNIEFCGDSTHSLSGETVSIPNWDIF